MRQITTFKVCLLGVSGQLGSCITRNGTLEHRTAGLSHSCQFLVLLLSYDPPKLQMLKHITIIVNLRLLEQG